MFECSSIRDALSRDLLPQFTCEQVGSVVHVVTPFPYPDNDLIELWLEEIREGVVRISDFGETSRRLLAQGFDLGASRLRRETAETLTAARLVEFDRMELSKSGPTEHLADLLLDVTVSARAVSDLVLTARTYAAAEFVEEVAGFLDEADLEFEQSVKVLGQSGSGYRVDFVLPAQGIYLQTLSPQQRGGMRAVVNRVFRQWSDINGHLPPNSKLSLVNDLDFEWSPPDIALLSSVADVEFWTRREGLAETLRTSTRASAR